MHYYNEFDPQAAAWLQVLIDQHLIPEGVVDTRSIVEVTAADLGGFVQCHFFAGIGGWPLALQLAGVPASTRLWTGSCPCQPFSVAGEGKGIEDERHLWPVFFDLIRECRPERVFGEQVASAAVLGSSAKPTKRSAGKAVQPVWLDGVFADLESAGYACGSSDIPAAGVGAPHIRQRCWWGAVRLADSDSQFDNRAGNEPGWNGADEAGSVAQGGGMGIADRNGRQSRLSAPKGPRQRDPAFSAGFWDDGGLGQSESVGCAHGKSGGSGEGVDQGECGRGQQDGPGLSPSAWDNSRWHPCRDGKYRRVPTEPGLFPLADGLPYKVARRRTVRPPLLRGAGNAICPEVAAIFVKAFYQVIAP